MYLGFIILLLLVFKTKKVVNSYLYLLSIITSIGSNKSIKVLREFINHTLINNEKYEFVDSTFVYQTKKDNRYIKRITNNKKLNIRLIDITDIFNSSKKNKHRMVV